MSNILIQSLNKLIKKLNSQIENIHLIPHWYQKYNYLFVNHDFDLRILSNKLVIRIRKNWRQPN